MAKRNSPAKTELAAPRTPGSLIGSFFLSYLIGFLLLAALVWYGNTWNVLGQTRLLDPLVAGGIIPLTDADASWGLFAQGIPDLGYYIASQDPVAWTLVLVAAGLFLLLAGVKAYQFHVFARSVGIEGSLGQHARAYIYGHGVNRMLPFDVGAVAAASALQGQGASPEQASRVVFLGRAFIVFEVVVYALIGLYLTGFVEWIRMLFWPLVILGLAYLLTRPQRGMAISSVRERFGIVRGAIRVLVREPIVLIWLALLSLLSFFLFEEAAYIVPQAFSGDIVVLNAEASTILMAVVGGYIARLIAVTPGGIGQFEWGFAATLFAGGVGFPDAVTIAVLVMAVRYVTGGLLFLAVRLTYGFETDLRTALAVFNRPETRPREAA